MQPTMSPRTDPTDALTPMDLRASERHAVMLVSRSVAASPLWLRPHREQGEPRPSSGTGSSTSGTGEVELVGETEALCRPLCAARNYSHSLTMADLFAPSAPVFTLKVWLSPTGSLFV